MTNNKKGFTLIELLVVIAIIGILSAIGLVSLNGAREKARDAKRQSDLAQIRSAMALYYDDQNPVAYYNTATTDDTAIQVDNANGDAAFKAALAVYLPNLPQIPSTTTSTDNNYWYVSTAAHFGLATKLEGGLKDWYILNDIGYGGTFAEIAARALLAADLTCNNVVNATAGTLEICLATPDSQ